MSDASQGTMGRGVLIFGIGMAVGLFAMVAELGLIRLTDKR